MAAIIQLVRLAIVCDHGNGGHQLGAFVDQAFRKAVCIAVKLGV